VTERACGECTLCCTVMRVDALRKRAGTPCRHLRRDGVGCAIHAERPRICRRYRCLWLQGGLEEGDRPDRLGAVLDLVTRAGQPHLSVREAEPGATGRSVRLRGIVERFRSALPVRVSDCRDAHDPDAPFRLLLPGGEERRVAGDRVTRLLPDAPAEERRLPASQRLARRLRTRYQRFRQRRW
jgi:hypothetical protein